MSVAAEQSTVPSRDSRDPGRCGIPPNDDVVSNRGEHVQVAQISRSHSDAN